MDIDSTVGPDVLWAFGSSLMTCIKASVTPSKLVFWHVTSNEVRDRLLTCFWPLFAWTKYEVIDVDQLALLANRAEKYVLRKLMAVMVLVLVSSCLFTYCSSDSFTQSVHLLMSIQVIASARLPMGLIKSSMLCSTFQNVFPLKKPYPFIVKLREAPVKWWTLIWIEWASHSSP